MLKYGFSYLYQDIFSPELKGFHDTVVSWHVKKMENMY